ncbi:MAG: T9SS type A sorting domain-containing protein [Bacteroidia bacterium]
MKKTLTLVLLALTSISYAQVDWAIKSLKKPTELVSTLSGTAMDMTIECENKGTTTFNAGDSIIFNMLLLRPGVPANQALIAEFPSRASAGVYSLHLLTSEVKPGETYDIEVNNLNYRGFVNYSLDVVFGLRAYALNQVDDDSTNNVSGTTITWWNIDRNGVSVDEVNFNNNIAAYPNPASDVLNVELLHTKLAEVKVELVDLTGKTVISKTIEDSFNGESYKLNVGEVENGMYILKVTNGTEVSTTKVSIAH